MPSYSVNLAVIYLVVVHPDLQMASVQDIIALRIHIFRSLYSVLCRCLTAWKNMDMHCFGDDSNIHTHPVLNGVHGSLRKLHSEAICAAHLLILPLDFTASI